MTTTHTITLCEEKLKSILDMIPLAEHNKRVSEIDHLANDPKLWSDPVKAGIMMKERQKLSSEISKVSHFQEQISFYKECAIEIPEEIHIYQNDISALHDEVTAFEFRLMFNDPVDDTPAILSINAGAGGLEAANWVTMLLRMYARYADHNGFKISILDEQRSEEHSSECIDSISIRIEGSYAYGFLKGESGVHRLIRNSPYDANFGRHTSFAAVDVTPDIEDNIEVEILDKDIEITAQRSGGPGGQNSNKVSSACRIKHFPTGINILVRIERDFHKNKSTALKMLKSKLYNLEVKKKEDKTNQAISELSNISFGHQRRSYIQNPQALVKDHVTGTEIRDFNGVLNGNIEQFIKSCLRQKKFSCVSHSK